jgi:MYXO-CTERM domain-containing protein
MNRIITSLALALAFAATTVSASATEAPSAALETGCPASAYRDASISDKSLADGSRYWQGDVLRVDDAGAARTQRTGVFRTSDGPDAAGAGLTRISSRVERLGQGITATPLVQSFISDPVGRAENGEHGAEPSLSMLLLAAAGVVLFVARRRRTD